jgi:deoxyribodipyrimidine photolyase-related protein
VNAVTLIFPHQLFEHHPALHKSREVALIEHPLFFGDFKYPLNFHKMKLTFHRASMKQYEAMLVEKRHKVHYIEYSKFKGDKNYLFNWLNKKKFRSIHFSKVDDFILDKRLIGDAGKNNIEINEYENPSFLNDEKYLRDYFQDKKSYFQHYFYIDQRKKFNILIENGKPVNGKWSFD